MILLGRSNSKKPGTGWANAVFGQRGSLQLHDQLGSCWQHQGWTLGIALALGMSGAIAFSKDSALAQNITVDGTLGPAQTLIRNGQTYDIPQGLGQTVDTNLFHSFGQFNLDTGEVASFQSDASIRNILSRVTGGSASLIDGKIYTQSPNVNLFFINPYGIVFGPNASLDVGLVGRSGFVATTVDALVWSNGGQFSATNPQGPSSLLTLVGDPGGFLSSSRPPGAIANLGGNLSVYDNQSLLLLGGNVSFDGGELNAQGGRVEIGAVGGAGTVGLEVGSDALSLNFPDDIARADVFLTNGAKINATTGQGDGNGIGNIRIQARAVSLTNGAQLDASTFGQQNAGIVVVDATDTVAIAGQNTFIRSDVESGAQGNAGGIAITAGSFFLTDGAQLITNTAGVGDAGVVVVGANRVVLDNSAIFSTVRTGAEGDAGGILIGAGSIALNNNAELQTQTSGIGDAGLVILQTNGGAVALDNSRIFSTVEPGAEGDAGGILIEAGSIAVNNNAELQTQTFGIGDAGLVFLQTNGGAVALDNSRIFSTVEPEAEGDAGNILIEARSIALNNATLETQTSGIGDAGVAILQTNGGAVALDNSSIFSSVEAGAEGDAGGILIEAASIALNNATLETQTFGIGDAGLVILQTNGGAVALDNSKIFSTVEPGAEGDAGNILIEAGSIALNNATLETQTFGIGDAGVTILQTNGGAVALDKSGIFSTVEAGAQGDAGGILIETGSLSLSNGGQLNASTFGEGNAGAVIVQATDAVSLNNESRILSGVGSTARGDGGGIIMGVGSLSVSNDSDLTTQTEGQGNAGLIGVQADRDISIRGDRSGIFSTVEEGSANTAGAILLQGRSLFVRDGAQISVNNQGLGEAGGIGITARNDIILSDGGEISATTLSGQGGNIVLAAGDFLVLRRDSNISTTAGLAPGGGDGGNMSIEARYILGIPVNDNNITAQAYEGRGGSISMKTNGLYSIAYRSDNFPNTNDITVSSTYGQEGEVEINNLNLDFTQGLTNLPQAPVDMSGQIQQRCALRGRDSDQVNKFTVTGRGGLPPSPNDTLQSESVLTNWVTTDPPVGDNRGDDSSTRPDSSVPPATKKSKTPVLVEAQGWVYGENGEVILTAKAPTATPHSPSLTPAASCDAY